MSLSFKIWGLMPVSAAQGARAAGPPPYASAISRLGGRLRGLRASVTMRSADWQTASNQSRNASRAKGTRVLPSTAEG
jgi:hypothetical protein